MNDRKLISVNGASLYANFNISDTENNFIYVHGGPGGTSQFFEEEFLKRYSSKLPVSLSFYDQRGCGRSLQTEELGHDHNIRDLCSIIEEKFQKGVWLIGHSYGSTLALCAANKVEKFIKGIVLISPIFSPYDASRSLYLSSIALLKNYPAEYEDAAINILPKKGHYLFECRDVIWSKLGDKSKIDKLYWFNPTWGEKYCEFKKKQNYDDSTYLKLREKLFDYSSTDFPNNNSEMISLLKNTSRPTFLIHGMEDVMSSSLHLEMFELFLGDSFSESSEYSCSGHSPHIEHMRKFINTLTRWTAK